MKSVKRLLPQVTELVFLPTCQFPPFESLSQLHQREVCPGTPAAPAPRLHSEPPSCCPGRASLTASRCCLAPGLGSIFSALALMPGSDELPCWYPRCSLRWGPAPSPTGGPASGGVLGWRLPLLPSAHRQSPRSPGHQPPLGPCPVPLCELLKQLQPLLCGCESPLHPAADDWRRDTLREGRGT